MVKRVIFGEVGNAQVAELKDMNAREFLVLAVLKLVVLGMGLYHACSATRCTKSVNDLIRLAASTKLPN